MKVQFSDIDEFFAELHQEMAEGIERRLLRVTQLFQPQPPGGVVLVLAGALSHGTLLEVRLPVGDLLPMRDRTTPTEVEQRADALVAAITARAEALGLEVRAGRFVP